MVKLCGSELTFKIFRLYPKLVYFPKKVKITSDKHDDTILIVTELKKTQY